MCASFASREHASSSDLSLSVPQRFASDSTATASQRKVSPSVVSALIVADTHVSTAQLLLSQLETRLNCPRAATATAISDVLSLTQSGDLCLVASELRLRDGTLLQLAEFCAQHRANVRLVAYSGGLPELWLERLQKLSLCGVLEKTSDLQTVLAGLEQVAHGHYLPLPRSPRFIALSNGNSADDGLPHDPHFTSDVRPAQPELYSVIRQLNERQFAVLVLLAEGLSVKEVAQQLRVSTKTVDSLKYRLMKQLDLHDRVELTRFAIREGLIDA